METLSANRLVLGPLLWTLYCQKNFSAPPPPPPVPDEVPDMLERFEQAEIVRRRLAFGVRGRQLSFELRDEPKRMKILFERVAINYTKTTIQHTQLTLRVQKPLDCNRAVTGL